MAVLLTVALAQDYAPDRLIIKLTPQPPGLRKTLALDQTKYTVGRALAPRMRIHEVRLAAGNRDIQAALDELRRNPAVEMVQLDHRLTRRETIPNDTQFGSQWNMSFIDATQAWDLTTGGVTPLGDTIVVAVVDGGCQVDHTDLAANLWVNRGEIPANGIDDDGNGYIDDIHGWNAYDNNGTINTDDHGTHVCGIVGAVGNNARQVSGLNWAVKIMPIDGAYTWTSLAMAAYGYVLDQRLLYDSTGGEKGAFIVATNSSFGIDFADCNSEDYPVWNAMYDDLGAAGILNAVATMNHNEDVDLVGDVPSGCASDFIISVTNTTFLDVKFSKLPGAAYGLTTIDLGAPGTDIKSTWPTDTTYSKTGTSMASPHVAGTVALMHAAMSPGLARFYRSDPATAALVLKQLLLDGVDPLVSLDGRTVTGGRLNLYNAVHLAEVFMDGDAADPSPVLLAAADNSQSNRILLTWHDPTTLISGDPIGLFLVDISRNGQPLTTVEMGDEYFFDELLNGGQTVNYDLVTRLIENDSTSVPVRVTTVVSGVGFIDGDANHDGLVNVADTVQLLRFMTGAVDPTEIDYITGDIDASGSLDQADLLAIVDTILRR
ncbi:MAG: S8 family serine peptidase [Candidatus Neomarinimicrobiota bacterium]